MFNVAVGGRICTRDWHNEQITKLMIKYDILVNDKVARVFCSQYYFWHSNENWSIRHECVNRKLSLSIVEFLSWEMFLISLQEEKNQVLDQTPRML